MTTSQTEADRAAAPAYIGRRPCGCIGFAAVDTPEHARATAKEVAACIRLGWTVERVTVAYVREHWGPGCPQCQRSKRATRAPAAQETLPL